MIFSSLIDIYHNINIFLGTPAGELAKSTLEFVLLFFMTYMTVSEYIRNRGKKQLKYMLIGFGTLTLHRFVLMAAFAITVFGNFPMQFIMPIVLTLSQAAESIGLIFVTGSYLYPLYIAKRKRLKNNISKETIFVILLFIITQGVILIARGIFLFPLYLVTSYFYFMLFKLLILLVTLVMLINNNNILGKYNPNVIQALIVYSITPFITVMNIMLYSNKNPYLYVLSHPFPIISVLLLLRVTYLKLADKAQLEEDLEVTKEKYRHEKAVGKLKDEFISTVSHELRTPLTSIKLYLSLLNEGRFGRITKSQKETVGIINSETSRLTNLINDILNLSRFEQRKEKLRKETVDLYFLVENAMPRNLAEEKNIFIDNKIPRPFFVNIDTERFTQVIINLFSNSLKFTKPGGKIGLRAVRHPDDFEFIISDTGKGIPKEKIPELFNKFFQIEEYMTRESRGIGLGLAIVKHIVELHKGTISVKSELAKGTTIRVRIPQD